MKCEAEGKGVVVATRLVRGTALCDLHARAFFPVWRLAPGGEAVRRKTPTLAEEVEMEQANGTSEGIEPSRRWRRPRRRVRQAKGRANGELNGRARRPHPWDGLQAAVDEAWERLSVVERVRLLLARD